MSMRRDPRHPASLLRLSEHDRELVHSLKNRVPKPFFRTYNHLLGRRAALMTPAR